MPKRFFVTLAFAVASAFALTVATPAYACDGDCDCAKQAGKKDAEKPGDKKGSGKKAALAAPAGALLAADKKCECEKGGKNCTCAKGECHCANCGKAEKKGA